MGIARANAPELTKGALSIAFVKNPNDPIWAKDPAVALYRSILKQVRPEREADRRLQLVRHDRRLDDGRDAAQGREEPHARRAPARGAEPRHDGEPVPAPRNPPADVANGLSPIDRSTSTATTTSSGSRRAGSSRRGDDATPPVTDSSTRTRRADEETTSGPSRSGWRRSSRSIAVPAAMAAYTSPKLAVHADGDDARSSGVARSERRPDGRASAIVIPNGTQLTTTQAPGTVLGPVKAQREGARPRRRRPAARRPADRRRARVRFRPRRRRACIGAASPPLATWVLVLHGGGSDAQRARRTSSRRAARSARSARRASRSACRRRTFPSEHRAARRSARSSRAPS